MMRQDVVRDRKEPRGLAPSLCVVTENVGDGFPECVRCEVPREVSADAPSEESEHGVEVDFDKVAQTSFRIALPEPTFIAHS